MRANISSRRARFALIAIVAVLLLACGAGAATPSPPPPPGGAQHPYALLADMQRDPAAAVRLPGSDVVGGGGSERAWALGRPRPAAINEVYGVQETAEAIIAYYDRELRAIGYTPADRGFLPSQTELAVRGWCKPGTATMRLAILDQTVDFLDSNLRDGRYRIIFDTYLAGLLPSETCPNP